METQQSYCTFAVTGANASFQPIFICRTCCNEHESSEGDGSETIPLCICQACAEHCHGNNDCDVEYIGMGPCYCDCDHVGNCCIFQKSQVLAERLGVVQSPIAAANSSAGLSLGTKEGPVRDFYDIPSLQDTSTTEELVVQAQELIRHSKETFWIDEKICSDSLCGLERVAWSIYQHHMRNYENLLNDETSNGGAEWWVQVKESQSEGKEGAIDLHYDKDEALAETFQLGSFPTLSTVTYLTPSKSAAPTLVFDHAYHQGEDNMMMSMLISRPRMGKHLVFDGSLLHGAPSHPDLRPKAANNSLSKTTLSINEPESQESSAGIRVTFLVNIWKSGKPAKVHPLDKEIREKVLMALEEDTVGRQGFGATIAPMVMILKEMPIIDLEKEEDLPESVRHRIELPFVIKGITWEDQLNLGSGSHGNQNDERNASQEEDDDSNEVNFEDYDDDEYDGGLVLVTFPPPPVQDTAIVRFGPGLQAYLDYPQAATSYLPDGGLDTPLQKTSTDYV